MELCSSILRDTPKPITEFRADLPVALQRIVERCLTKEVTERYAFASELRDSLNRLDRTIASGFRRVIPDGGNAESSIAVMPFTNMSADPDNEFFADGITEEIINILTRIEDLRVAAKTSAFAFKGKQVDLRIVGERLNVKTVLEGSVRKAGNRVRIIAELTNVADGYHFWSERYDRELTDIFAIQEEIAQAIVAHLKLRLSRPNQPLVIRPTESISAYHAYLEGRYQSYRYAPDALERSKEFFERATDEDPNFSLAYVGLADKNCFLVL